MESFFSSDSDGDVDADGWGDKNGGAYVKMVGQLDGDGWPVTTTMFDWGGWIFFWIRLREEFWINVVNSFSVNIYIIWSNMKSTK